MTKKSAKRQKATRVRRPSQLKLHTEPNPKADYNNWRHAIGASLKYRIGASASLARRLDARRQNVSDWFSSLRTDPPGWVVHMLLTEATKKEAANA